MIQLSNKRLVAFLHDVIMIPIAWLGAYWLRFNLDVVPEQYLTPGLYLLPFVIIIQSGFFWYFGLYRGVWRYASIPDLMRIGKAVFFAALTGLLIYIWIHIPRSILPLYSILLVALLSGPRLLFRWFKDHKLAYKPGQRVLIAGAGHAGEQLIRDLLRAPDGDYLPVAFIDDDPDKKGREIHGIRILGTIDQLPKLVPELAIELVLIAIPSANHHEMKRLVEYCEQANVMFKTLPTTVDVISGKVSINDLREVSIEDLLGRDPVSLDWEAIRQGISGKRVLVTGGGGSIGSELCRQICALKPEALTIFDQSEFNLFIIENELKERFSGLVLNARLGDVCDTVAVEHLMDIAKPNIVFHAAAYKHVPMLEDQVREAAHNNIIGTSNVVSASIQHNVEEFVLISTDKAVNPTNIMGSSKRIAEMLCQKTLNDVSTKFITVRFGNVLNSAGSVVPIFREQIASGGPVTVTHEEITRYFMTIPEACQLIMQAGVIGQGGEIFVLDMGEPVKIKYLAEQMIILSGKEPGVDIEIQYMGLRPGEKLFEELFHENEALTPTVHEKIRLANSRDFDSRELDEVVDQIREAAQRYDEMTIRQAIEMLVPEYHSGNDEIRSAAAILNKAG